MKHWETHPEFVDGCYGCKLTTINMSAAAVSMERRGDDVSGGMGTASYVRNMYEKRRAAGQPDPEPENAKAARYAPKMPLEGRKKYREINNGL